MVSPSSHEQICQFTALFRLGPREDEEVEEEQGTKCETAAWIGHSRELFLGPARLL